MTKTMISARIPEKLDRDLAGLAEMTSRSKAFLLTEALEEYVERKGWIIREIDSAVADAAKDGSYVSEDDMAAWFKTWGKRDKAALPRLRDRDELP
jgi:RHH-type transcriptional regulator, rel operon repressor / antitoxin RelB